METKKKKFKRKLFLNNQAEIQEKPDADFSNTIVATLQSKVKALQSKYTDFISKCITNIKKDENPSVPVANNNIMIKKSTQKKPSQLEHHDTEDTIDYSNIVDYFTLFESLLPQELEKNFNDLKIETFKHIHLLKKRLNYVRTEIIFLKNKNEKKPIIKVHCETQTTSNKTQSYTDTPNKNSQIDCMVTLSDELSRSKESIKVLRNRIFSQLASKRDSVPKLKINKIIPISPDSLKYSRICQSTSRVYRNNEIDTHLKDSAVNQPEPTEKNKISGIMRTAKAYARNINNICENSYENFENKVYIIRQLTENFNSNANIFETEALEYMHEEEKLKEQLERCKKIAAIYENKLKVKNETVCELRKKLKKKINDENQAKEEIQVFAKNYEHLIQQLIGEYNYKINQIYDKLYSIQGNLKNKIEMNLEELKEIMESTNKGEFFDQEIEILKKNIERLEFCNKELFQNNQYLSKENEEVKISKQKTENYVKELKEELSETKQMLIDLENTVNSNSSLSNVLKIKEFELKQAEFEKNALMLDKSEMLNRIETLEIEIIEARECYRDLNVKYNNQIEDLVFSNAINNNQILQLQKDLTESINRNEELSKITNDKEKKQNDLLLKYQKIEKILIEKETEIKKLQELLSKFQSNSLEKQLSEKEILYAELLNKYEKISEILKENENEILLLQQKLNSLQNTYELLKEDILIKEEKYKGIIEDLKLDKYQLQKDYNYDKEKYNTLEMQLTSYEEKILKLNEQNSFLECSLNKLTEENQILDSIKNNLLNKVSELEDDLKSLIAKLLKLTDHNAFLEDAVLHFSPKSLSVVKKNFEKTDILDENIKLKAELLQIHNNFETISNNQSQIESKLNFSNNLIIKHQIEIEKISEESNGIKKNYESQLLENEKLIETNNEYCKEIDKLKKNSFDLMIKIRNEEVTYTKNISYLEQIIKELKHKHGKEMDIENTFYGEIKPDLFSHRKDKPLQISSEKSIFISALKKVYYKTIEDSDSQTEIIKFDHGNKSIEDISHTSFI